MSNKIDNDIKKAIRKEVLKEISQHLHDYKHIPDTRGLDKYGQPISAYDLNKVPGWRRKGNE